MAFSLNLVAAYRVSSDAAPSASGPARLCTAPAPRSRDPRLVCVMKPNAASAAERRRHSEAGI